MTRRAWLLGGCALALGFAGRAQTAGPVRRLGFMRTSAPNPGQQRSVREALAGLGWRDGDNIRIDWRWVAQGASADQAAAALVGSGVELIMVADTPVAHAAARATRTLPIVLMGIADPVGSGLVRSLARPGGNITGASRNLPALAGKKLELLKAAVPAATRFGFLGAADDPATPLFVANTLAAGTRLGVQVTPWRVRGATEFGAAFAAMAAARMQAVVVQPLFATEFGAIAELALRYRLASISDFRSYAEAGGMLSYGELAGASIRRAANYVDRILRGTPPGELPIEEPRHFELVVNQKTARALGLTIPPALLLRADALIE